MGKSGVIMKNIAATILCILVFLMAVTASDSAEVSGDVLLRWPQDFAGVAEVPPTIRHIGLLAFSQCKSLIGVVLPESLETIGPLAFSGSIRLRDVRIPPSVTNIGDSAFFNCQSLTSIVIRARTKNVPNGFCARCCRLRCVEIPDGTVEIGDRAFLGCRSIEGLHLPASVSRIGRCSFAGCSRLRGITLPQGLKSVGEYAFDGCYDLESVAAYPDLATVGANAFRNCFRLKGVVATKDKAESDVGNEKRGDGAYAEMLEGLETVLRIASDGLVNRIPDEPGAVDTVGRLDALAANLFRLKSADDVQEIKGLLRAYSPISMDDGGVLKANLDFYGDIAVSIEFRDGRMVKVSLSKKLKDLVRKKLADGDGEVGEDVLRWIRR